MASDLRGSKKHLSEMPLYALSHADICLCYWITCCSRLFNPPSANANFDTIWWLSVDRSDYYILNYYCHSGRTFADIVPLECHFTFPSGIPRPAAVSGIRFVTSRAHTTTMLAGIGLPWLIFESQNRWRLLKSTKAAFNIYVIQQWHSYYRGIQLPELNNGH